MSRARTKVAKWWETSYDRSIHERDYASVIPKRGRKAAHAIARVNGGKVFHVTRYQLAPLVKLVWRVSPECPDELDAWSEERGAVATIHPGGRWYVWDPIDTGQRPSNDEAKAACAARLLELGYRVVDEKGGAR